MTTGKFWSPASASGGGSFGVTPFASRSIPRSPAPSPLAAIELPCTVTPLPRPGTCTPSWPLKAIRFAATVTGLPAFTPACALASAASPAAVVPMRYHGS